MFSIDNFKSIYGVLHQFFTEKYGLDIGLLNDGVVDVKKLVYRHMRAVNAASPGASLREKDKLVLRDAKEDLLTLYVRLRESADASRAAEQQRLMASNRALPDAPGQYSGNDVMKEYAAMVQSRQQERAVPLPAGAVPKIDDEAFSTAEFARRLESLQEARNGAVPPANAFVPAQAAGAAYGGLPGDGSRRAPPRLVRLLLNSADRDVVAYPHSTRFRVRFGLPTWQTSTTTVIHNNALVPGTRTVHFDGVANAGGFFFAGAPLPAYNPLVATPHPLLPSDIVGESSAQLPSDANASVGACLDDVMSVAVEEVVIAHRPGDTVPAVITVTVAEMDGDVDGTNDDTFHALCAMTISSVHKTGANTECVVYQAAYRQERTFPAPLQNVRYATIAVRDADGLPYVSAPDGAVVVGVSCNGSATVISLGHPAAYYDIVAGDVVRLSEVMTYPVGAADTDGVVHSANAYFNRREGHAVLAVAGNDVTIGPPGKETPGGFVPDATVGDFITRFVAAVGGYAKYVYGYVVNASKQMTIGVAVAKVLSNPIRPV